MKERNINLDLIRSVAIFSVLSVHFFLNNGFYNYPIVEGRMYIMVAMRTFFMICVPLFLILTGYLMNKKKISAKYFFGGSIRKTYMIYLMVSICCIIFRMVVEKEKFTFFTAILSILDFSGAPYSWYIEMYIGLFLLIPFLNMIWNGIEEQRGHIIFLMVLFVCTVAPSILNIKYKIIPAYWENLWPFTYYFLGCYLKKYDLKLKIKYNLILLLVFNLLISIFNGYMNRNGYFQRSNFVEWGSWENVINSCLVFALLLHLPLSSLNSSIKKMILKISEVSLAMYLISSCSDTIVYHFLNQRILSVPQRLEWYFIVVPVSFLLSFIGGQFIVWLNKGVDQVCKKKVLKN